LALLAGSESALATDIGAVINGNWNNTATWTPSQVPGSADRAFIGSNFPAGSANAATVTLTANQAVDTVIVGENNGSNGTLNLGTFTLTIGSELEIGANSGAVGTVTRGAGGSLKAPTVAVFNSNSLSFGAGDVATQLNINTGGAATTAATGNVTSGVTVYTTSQINLGANMTLSGAMDGRDSSTVDAQHHAITADTI
jgi:hypothetical protein